MARVPASSLRRKPATTLTAPVTIAPLATTNTRTKAVGPSQAAMRLAAMSTSASSRCPNTGPAVRLLNACMEGVAFLSSLWMRRAPAIDNYTLDDLSQF